MATRSQGSIWSALVAFVMLCVATWTAAHDHQYDRAAYEMTIVLLLAPKSWHQE